MCCRVPSAPRPPGRCQIVGYIARGHRPSEQVTLPEIASEPLQALQLSILFDPLRGGFDAQSLAEADDRSDDFYLLPYVRGPGQRSPRSRRERGSNDGASRGARPMFDLGARPIPGAQRSWSSPPRALWIIFALAGCTGAGGKILLTPRPVGFDT